MKNKVKAENDDYDSPWKEILEQYFPEFTEFFFSKAYHDIDWIKGWEFMDKEFQQTKDKTRRKDEKLAIIKLLYQKGYLKQDIINLFRFIDWIMFLPKKRKSCSGRNLKPMKRREKCRM